MTLCATLVGLSPPSPDAGTDHPCCCVLRVACPSTGDSFTVTRTLQELRDLGRAARRSPLGHLLPPFPPHKKLKKMVTAALAPGGDEEGDGEWEANPLLRRHALAASLLNAWLSACASSEACEEAWWQHFLRRPPLDTSLCGVRGQDGSGRAAEGGTTASGVLGGLTTPAAATPEEGRSRARALNQYFTRVEEATALVAAALAAANSTLSWATLPDAPHTGQELVLVEPAAGGGAIFDRLPLHLPASGGRRLPVRRIGIEIDSHYAHKHGFLHADFLRTTRQSLGLDGVPRSRVLVIMNPPFVAHGSGGSNKRSGATARDAGLAARFVVHALQDLCDLVVALLPARFAREAQRRGIADACAVPLRSWLLGDVRGGSRFDLAGCEGKEITQPSVIVAFLRCHPPSGEGGGESENESDLWRADLLPSTARTTLF
eukprot:jgi/Tetstr1/445978/TSEL_003535.t1